MDWLKNKPEEVKRIAENGQAMMKHYWSKEGKKEFVDHVINELKLQ